jgi:glucan phosphoethanolaminetransferase (alkaline phosphatase superfamily)
VLVVLDTLRADHVSAYGYGRDTTRHLDGLAAEGVLFEAAISNSAWRRSATGSSEPP